MDGYAVKVDELGKLIADLDTAADRMADANRKLGGGGAFGSLGNAELGRAGAEFEEAWGYGIGRLGDAAVGITERLKQAKGKYEQIEAQFGGELGKFGSDVFGSGDGPVGGGITGGMPGAGELADRGDRQVGLDEPADQSDPVGGGYTGGVAGIDDLAERAAPDNRPVGGGATGGITDLLNGLDR
ncbi:hypothetical protein [Amycolatopsis sp. NBC_01286]|uniref:hypothetical protein n=1 Tax=Amycolatopsis sp. NBC_01286 TaxID=2903560 RepID=UPI002E14BDAB|nr:hypothetical protein OG570_13420 [Amycolatopsis sp. NBC_01286]